MNPKFILIPLFVFIATFAYAQTYRNEFGIQTDNDSYLLQGSDRYYTDGLFFYFRHALPVRAHDSTALQNKILGFELGQKIFNPQSGKIPAAEYIDRPFAGYTYIGSTLNFLYKDESNLKIGAQLGVVGPASGAQQVQTFVHNTFGFYHVEGWQYQVKNDPELNLSAEYNKLLARTTAFDFSLASYLNIGNGFTGAGAGPLFRLGNFNQLFYSESTQSTITANNQITPLHPHEFFFYYQPQLNYVAHDATIQGGLFESHNDPGGKEITLAPEPLVFSNQLGLTYTANRWIFDVDAIFHTRDTKLMIHPDQWGSISALYRFN
jgi:lipid A 3-O-deacylase